VSREPIPEERLDALRTLDLAVIAPQSANWRPAMRVQVARMLRTVAGPVITELLDEIDELDDVLDASENEVDELLAEVGRPRSPEPVISAVRLEHFNEYWWRVRWREDGTQKSASFDTPDGAEAFEQQLLDRQRRGGAR
jgi:translation elongation factor EF-Tu-like GTPase